MFIVIATSDYNWPDGIDWTVTVLYFGLSFGVVVAGYTCMVLDIHGPL